MSIDAVRALLARSGRPAAVAPDIGALRAEMDAFGAAAPLCLGWQVEACMFAGRPAERHVGPEARSGRCLVYLHGGSYVAGSPRSHRGLISRLARAAGAGAVALDYRLAPEHQFPAALDDSAAAVAQLIAEGQDPAALALVGDSAGGGLALATALRLRDAGTTVAALFLISPWADLANAGPSHAAKAAADPMLSKPALDAAARAYAGDRLTDPLVSPVYANLAGLPPLLMHVGSEEILLSDAERLYRSAEAAGIDVALETWPRMIHVWHAFYPILEQGADAIDSAGAWLARRLTR